MRKGERKRKNARTQTIATFQENAAVGVLNV